MIFPFLISLLVGLLDGALIHDAWNGKVTQNWGNSGSFFTFVIGSNVAVVATVIIYAYRGKTFSSGVWISGMAVSYVIGLAVGIYS